MSTFTDYDTVSKNYDYGRKAVGLDFYIGALLTRLGKPLNDVHVLDAGCGTGNYAKALLDRGVGKVTLLDGSEGMLEHAKRKCDGPHLADAKHHFLPTLPFVNNSFDCVMFNNVLHHLETPGQVKQTPKAVEEAFRVLRPGGLLIIFNLMEHQLEKGFWFAGVLPELAKRYKDGMPSVDWYLSILNEQGFQNVDVMSPLTLLLCPEVYYDSEGPLKPEWRSTHSLWSMATAEEISSIEEKLRQLKAGGKLQDYFEKLDKDRKLVGQSSFFFASKP